MNVFFARFIKSNPIAIFFSIFLLFFIVLILTPFFYNNKSLLNNIPDNLAWAQIDPNLDSDGDGISDILELEGDPNNDKDTDKDGTKDFLDKDTCTMPTATDEGSISLQLWLYECDPNCEQIKDPNIIFFTGCRDIEAEEIDLPSSYGDFPYGLWEFQVKLSPEFKHYDDDNEIYHKITLEIFYPGPTKPLSSEYWAKGYKDEKVKWSELKSEGLYFSDFHGTSDELVLENAKLDDNKDIISGFGDKDPSESIIEHLGGLLWPIPVEGRCFIDHIWSKSPH